MNRTNWMKGVKHITQQVPSDLIPIRTAMDIVNRSRGWIEARVPVFRVGRQDMVSRDAVLQAEKEYSTPKPKEREGDED